MTTTNLLENRPMNRRPIVAPSPDRAGLPPPLSLDLTDGDHTVGWITGDKVGFRGFADETEAAHAAWVAYRTLSRRLARTHNTRPAPIDIEPLALRRNGAEEAVLASGRPIAELLRPGNDSPSVPDSFGFELRIPAPVDELRARAMAHLMYRTLRKSGLRWALWRGAGRPVTAVAPPVNVSPPPRAAAAPSGTAFIARIALAAAAMVVAVALIVTAPPTVAFPVAIALAVGLTVSGLTVAGRSRSRKERRPGGTKPPTATPLGNAPRSDEPTHDDRRNDGPVSVAGWMVRVAVSLGLIALAVLVPNGNGAILAAIGVGGLAVYRMVRADRDPLSTQSS